MSAAYESKSGSPWCIKFSIAFMIRFLDTQNFSHLHLHKVELFLYKQPKIIIVKVFFRLTVHLIVVRFTQTFTFSKFVTPILFTYRHNGHP
jgi:hypothetical protein